MMLRQEMSQKLGREVGLRVAMCDYFFNINKELENPIIIEIEVFDATERLSDIDGLTGLYNRRYLDVALAREIARAKRYDTDLSLLFLDIKHYRNSP